MCSGSVVVTVYDFQSGRPGSNLEWGLVCYEASITAQGLPEPSSPRSSTLGTRADRGVAREWFGGGCNHPSLKIMTHTIHSNPKSLF